MKTTTTGPETPGCEGLHAAILAGGQGKRFWPLSTPRCPKPFIDLFDGETMIQATWRRLRGLLPAERIVVVVGERHAELTADQLPELAADNLLLEPTGRDTAAAVAYAAEILRRRSGPEACMALIPADHFIGDDQAFCRDLGRGAQLARQQAQSVTFGIAPTRPDPGYGYLALGERRVSLDDVEAVEVRRFLEKPDPASARRYCRAGCLWNSGIFVWQLGRLARLVDAHLPELGRAVRYLVDDRDAGRTSRLAAAYAALPKTSIDFGLMEHAAGTWCIPASFTWDDVGTWAALRRVLEPDGAGNLILGGGPGLRLRHVRHCTIYRDDPGREVLLAHLEGMVVVCTEQGVLMLPEEQTDHLKALLDP